MKNGGDFVSLPAKEGWKKGDIVPVKTKPRSRRFLTAAAAIAACLCFVVTGGGYHYYYAQAALISVDVNPSIELTVNRLDRVTSSSALNEDGEALGHPADRHGVRGSGKRIAAIRKRRTVSVRK